MNMMVSYLYYLGTFGISTLFAALYGERDKRKIRLTKKIAYAILIAFPVVILEGFRYDVGTDYFSYASLSQGFAQNDQVFYGWYSNEPLFLLVSKISYFIGNGNIYFWFVVDAIIQNCLLFAVADYYKNEISLPIFYIFYYCLLFPYFLNTERQGTAILLVWFALRYLDQNKTIKFLACIIVATLYHNSAIIGLIFYFFKTVQKSQLRFIIKRILIFIMLCAPLWLRFGFNLLGRLGFLGKYTRYWANTAEESLNVSNANLAFFIAMGVFILIGYARLLKKIKNIDRWIFLYVCQLVSFFANAIIAWGMRLSYCFFFGIFYIYGAVGKMVKQRENRLFFYFIVGVFAVFHFTYKYYIQGNSDIFPYQFVWMQ